MELKYIHLSELFGEPIEAARVEALAARLSSDPRLADIAAEAMKKKNTEKRAETLCWLYLLGDAVPNGSRLQRDKNGKPQADGIYFSVSHGGGLCAIAVGDSPIGLDVERVREFPSRERFAARCFSEKERAAAQDELGFFAVWTKKEAYFKKTGVWADISFEDIETRELNVNGNKFVISICQ